MIKIHYVTIIIFFLWWVSIFLCQCAICCQPTFPVVGTSPIGACVSSSSAFAKNRGSSRSKPKGSHCWSKAPIETSRQQVQALLQQRNSVPSRLVRCKLIYSIIYLWHAPLHRLYPSKKLETLVAVYRAPLAINSIGWRKLLQPLHPHLLLLVYHLVYRYWVAMRKQRVYVNLTWSWNDRSFSIF